MPALPMSSALHSCGNAAPAHPGQQGVVKSWDHGPKQPQKAGLLGPGYSDRHSRRSSCRQTLETQQIAARLDVLQMGYCMMGQTCSTEVCFLTLSDKFCNDVLVVARIIHYAKSGRPRSFCPGCVMFGCDSGRLSQTKSQAGLRNVMLFACTVPCDQFHEGWHPSDPDILSVRQVSELGWPPASL